MDAQMRKMGFRPGVARDAAELAKSVTSFFTAEIPEAATLSHDERTEILEQLDQLSREVESAGENKVLDAEAVQLFRDKIAQAHEELGKDYVVLHNTDHDPEDTLKPHDARAEREEAELTKLSRRPKRKIRRQK
jgi:hypothetical protein